jgi:hypothetical protein
MASDTLEASSCGKAKELEEMAERRSWRHNQERSVTTAERRFTRES